MPTVQDLEQAETAGTLGPKSKAFLEQYRSSKVGSGTATNGAIRQNEADSGPIGRGIAQSQALLKSGAGTPVTPIRQFAIPRPSPEFQKAHPTLSGVAIGGSKLAESALSPLGGATLVASLAAPMIGIPARAMALGGAALMTPQIAGHITSAIQTKDPEQRAENLTQAAGLGLGAYGALREGILPSRGMGLPAKAIEGWTPEQSASVDSMIANKFTKAIRPSVVGKSGASDIEAYNARAVDAVKSVIANKGNLSLVDKNLEPSGKLPATLNEFTQAVEQTKKSIFDKYNALQKQAGQQGAKVDLNPIVSELKLVASKPEVNDLHPEVAKFASDMADTLQNRGPVDPALAQSYIASLNGDLETFYKNPTAENTAKAPVQAMMAKLLRKGMDESITKSTAPGYQELKNQYGALASIENDVAHRAVVDARRNSKGLLDYTDIASASDLVRGIATGNPADIALSATKKGVAEYLKFRNNPNSIVKSMFYGADKQYGQ